MLPPQTNIPQINSPDMTYSWQQNCFQINSMKTAFQINSMKTAFCNIASYGDRWVLYTWSCNCNTNLINSIHTELSSDLVAENVSTSVFAILSGFEFQGRWWGLGIFALGAVLLLKNLRWDCGLMGCCIPKTTPWGIFLVFAPVRIQAQHVFRTNMSCLVEGMRVPSSFKWTCSPAVHPPTPTMKSWRPG